MIGLQIVKNIPEMCTLPSEKFPDICLTKLLHQECEPWSVLKGLNSDQHQLHVRSLNVQ